MTQSQKSLYWREWAACKAVRRAHGLSDTDEARHALHVQALGRDRSMKHLSNAEFDRVLAVFRATSRPDDLAGQLRQIDQPADRLLELHRRIAALTAECEIKDGIDGLSLYFRSWFKGRSYEDLDERGLQQLAGILARRTRTLRLKAEKNGDPF